MKLAKLSKETTGDPRELAQTINRAVIFNHANRLRTIIGKLIDDLHSDPETLSSFLELPTKNGSMKTVKPLLDLSKALESVSILTQRALGDTPDERPKGVKKTEDLGSITTSVLEALAHASGLPVDHAKEVLNAPPET